jgi:hypothetical protein
MAYELKCTGMKTKRISVWFMFKFYYQYFTDVQRRQREWPGWYKCGLYLYNFISTLVPPDSQVMGRGFITEEILCLEISTSWSKVISKCVAKYLFGQLNVVVVVT